MTATDRSGSEGKAQSSVGLQRLVGWNPRSNLLRLRNGGIGLKLGAATRVEKRLGRDFPHDSLLFRHSLFERRVEGRTDDDGDSLRFCTEFPFPARFYGLDAGNLLRPGFDSYTTFPATALHPTSR